MLLSMLPAADRVLDIECSQVIHVLGKWVNVTVWHVPNVPLNVRYVAVASMCNGLHLPAELAHDSTLSGCLSSALQMLEPYVTWGRQ
jgi:hypothetical protein